ncbi:hypothetical protein AO073_05945 [Pseudomonas syringae ICMP 11293]|uniref:hypothetical protein n=1 Tax=Pseudomonas syringae TaxID=317 RepID=UPI0007309900|nr:hypothetical protein [Pseudomonas syringae]KTB90881.1 hypothetical protein AO073_05945 [Pseudomonas syringae ICMP 11293]
MSEGYDKTTVDKAQSPVVKRTANHINEHCTSVIVLSMSNNGGTRIALQFGRDMTELSDGTTRGKNIVNTYQHTFANMTIDAEEAVRMANAILDITNSANGS